MRFFSALIVGGENWCHTGVIVVIGCVYEENSLYGWVCDVTLIVKTFFRKGG